MIAKKIDHCINNVYLYFRSKPSKFFYSVFIVIFFVFLSKLPYFNLFFSLKYAVYLGLFISLLIFDINSKILLWLSFFALFLSLPFTLLGWPIDKYLGTISFIFLIIGVLKKVFETN